MLLEDILHVPAKRAPELPLWYIIETNGNVSLNVSQTIFLESI